MFLFILEIVLTIIVWKKGWKWYALIPYGSAIVIAFFIGWVNEHSQGFAMTVSPNGVVSGYCAGGIDPHSAVWIDIAAVITLIVMFFKKKNIIKATA